ncbi:hypothetical protein ABI59_22775 [Acidobacteria bacterium Mor1]|nr:hypothetical protein ABI59_22775 [Acidobacteria bacterium Mor1]
MIPDAWFVGRSQFVLVLISAFGIAVLGKGADWLVEGASGMAYRMGISKVIVGATIVSLGTTSPECAVSVMAAWGGQPGLALGNAVGSVIADTGLIFGLGCLLTVLPADKFVLQRQGWIQFGSGVLLAALAYGAWISSGDQATLGRWVGLLLLALLGIYMWISIRWSKIHPHGEPFQGHDGEEIEEASHKPWAVLAVSMVVGLALVLVSSRVLIASVTVLAEDHWHIPQVVIAGTLVAFGTSLPELVIGMASLLKGHKEILVGNVIGADILNVLFVVGAAAAAAPLPIVDPTSTLPEVALYVHLPAMLLILLMFRIFIVGAVRRGNFQRWQGVPLILAYVAYVVVQIVMTR